MPSVLMFTGGIDSTVAYFYLKKELGEEVDLMFLDLGHKYTTQEDKAIKKLAKRLGVNVKTQYLNWGIYEKENAEIPGRNALIALAGMVEGYNKIWMVFQKGETNNESRDRSPEFCQKMSALLSYMAGKEIVVDSPFWDMTKTEMVAWAIDNVPNAGQILEETFSCYYPTQDNQPCGNCGACFRRSMAMELNGIRSVFLSDEIIEKYDKNIERYQGNKRYNEMKEFLDRIYHRNGAEARSLWYDGKPSEH